MSNKYVVVDLETTGNSPKKGDKIIQFAAVVIENGVVVEEFSSLINPKQSIPIFIEELTGLTDVMVKDAPTFPEIAPKVMELLEDAYFVAHNVLFDLSFLQEELIMAGYEGFFGHVLDTVELARILFPTSDSYKLSDLARQQGLQHDRPHQADSDAYVTGELLLIFFDKLQRLPIPVIKQLYKLSTGLKSDLEEILAEILLGKEKLNEKIPAHLTHYRGIVFKKQSKDTKEVPCTDMDYPVNDSDKEQLLSKAFSKYEKRNGQFKMMDLVYDSFITGHHALIEAGTGVGKSLAYLVPSLNIALKSQKPVIISTYTTQLQEQLLQKDIPLLTKMLGCSFKTVLLKGKQHYISLEKFAASLRETEDHYDTILTKMQILVWLTETTTGDRDELNLSSGSYQYWNKIKFDGRNSENRDSWIGREYYSKVKDDVNSAHIIITNHSFLLIDLVSERPVLPEYQHLVIDEGHHFEKTARKLFGKKFDYAYTRSFLHSMGLREQKGLANQMDKLSSKIGIRTEDSTASVDLNQIMGNLTFEMDEFFRICTFMVKKNRNSKAYGWVSHRLDHEDIRDSQTYRAAAERFLFLLIQYMDGMNRYYDILKLKIDKNQAKQKMILSQLGLWLDDGKKMVQSIREIFLKPSAQHVHWIELDTRALQNKTTVYAQPISVAELLNEIVFQQKKSVVMTSATLSVNGSFHYMKNELGLKDCLAIQIPSPFCYEDQVRLVIPNDLPEINSVSLDEYVLSIGEHIISIAEATKGRMLLLFTSYEMLRKTYDLIKESGFLQEYTILAQGVTSGSRTRLTRNFQRFDKAILLGTNSFWEGIDIPGEDLSCLVIVRLPFSPPDEPQTEAKCVEIKKKGGNPFYDYSLPEAVIRFKQGFGRLIRTKDDKGMMIVFDRRIVTTRYGKAFLDSLPKVKANEMNIHHLVQLIDDWL